MLRDTYSDSPEALRLYQSGVDTSDRLTKERLVLQVEKLRLEVRVLRGPSSGRNAHEYARDMARASR